MTPRFAIICAATILALPLVVAMVPKKPQGPGEPVAMPPRTTFPQPDADGDRQPLDVLTKPRYQDVPALNRPMMLRECQYKDGGCSE